MHPNLFWYDQAGLCRTLREVRPDIVDLHEEPYSLAVALALRAIRRETPQAKLCIYTAQNLPKRYPPPFNWVEQRALKAAAAAYPCSTEACERLQALEFRGPIHVIPLGVTVPSTRTREPGRPRVGFVGRLEPYKGAMIALRAFAQVSKTVDASFEVIGSGSEEQALRRYAMQAELGNRVEFAGPLPQDVTLTRIARLDVLLIPSLTTSNWKEQFGRVATQAMAATTAIVASDSGSLREVVADGGLLVPEGDVEAFATELGRLLVSPDLITEMASRGRERVKRALSWECVVDRVDEMYRGAMNYSPARLRVQPQTQCIPF
jgi:glycosyltransferase involved in cell wall biosynthesis